MVSVGAGVTMRGRYEVVAPVAVRAGIALNSRKLLTLSVGDVVVVRRGVEFESVGSSMRVVHHSPENSSSKTTRVEISSPISGWTSIVSSQGVTCLRRCLSEQDFPAIAATPANYDVEVIGAGSVAANGMYRYDTNRNERPSWRHGDDWYIHFFGEWCIGPGPSKANYDNEHKKSVVPPMSGWNPYGIGLAPAPTLRYHRRAAAEPRRGEPGNAGSFEPAAEEKAALDSNDPKELLKLPMHILRGHFEDLGGEAQTYGRFTTKREIVEEIQLMRVKRKSVQLHVQRKKTEAMSMEEAMHEIQRMQSQKWNCTLCTFENTGEHTRCQMCRTPAPGTT